MTLTDIKFVNPQGGIQAHNSQSGADVYLRPGDLLHDLVLAGHFGPVAPYAPPPPPEALPKYATAEKAITALVKWLDRISAPLVSGTTLDERLSWPMKEAAARAYLSGSASTEEAALIEAEAEVTGEAAAELAALILQKAAVYRPAVALVVGLRRKTAAALEAESDPHQFEVILGLAAQEAALLARDLGLSEVFSLEDAAA